MVKEVLESERKKFNELSIHPLQSWEWGDFRLQTGVTVSRLGWYAEDDLRETAQVTWHKIPKTPLRVGYWPKGGIPSEDMIRAVTEEAKKRKAIFVKIEPNILLSQGQRLMEELDLKFKLERGTSLFTKWSFWLDMTKSEDELLSEMKPKTRYNIKYAQRKGVEVVIDNSEEAFLQYWRLTEETTKRQGFYAHTREYHLKMFKTLQEAGKAFLFKAIWQGKVLVTWIVFLHNGVIYYPYGGSTREDKSVQASSAMMWEVIKWGKSKGAKLFDMWGSPGPEPKETDPWYGFHRFKVGFGAELVEFVGTYDLVINPILYRLYQAGNGLRWMYLRLRKK